MFVNVAGAGRDRSSDVLYQVVPPEMPVQLIAYMSSGGGRPIKGR
jgi:hypothetical protein